MRQAPGGCATIAITKRKEVVQLARQTNWDLGGGWPLVVGSWTACESQPVHRQPVEDHSSEVPHRHPRPTHLPGPAVERTGVKTSVDDPVSSKTAITLHVDRLRSATSAVAPPPVPVHSSVHTPPTPLAAVHRQQGSDTDTVSRCGTARKVRRIPLGRRQADVDRLRRRRHVRSRRSINELMEAGTYVHLFRAGHVGRSKEPGIPALQRHRTRLS